MSDRPSVSVVIPVLDEERHLEATLATVLGQDYDGPVEVVVVDGGSTDRTRDIATAHPGVRLLDNPHRLQAPALNIGIEAATGEVIVRVDGHCQLAADYVRSCVDALASTGAVMVGGAMRPRASGWRARGIAAAMSSRLGAGPARFHVGGSGAWVDTVYLGAFRRADALAAGGYDEDFPANEDAEFAIRMSGLGGIWFDPTIHSTYTPRQSFRALAKQFFRYGRSRAKTVRRHPRSMRARQAVAPLLVLALLTPWRRRVAMAYLGGVGARTAMEVRREPEAAPGFALALPTMHLAWGVGFLVGLVRPPTGARRTSSDPSPAGRPAAGGR